MVYFVLAAIWLKFYLLQIALYISLKNNEKSTKWRGLGLKGPRYLWNGRVNVEWDGVQLGDSKAGAASFNW